MDIAKLEERKAELAKRFEEVKAELKELGQKSSNLQNELVAINGAYAEVCKMIEAEAPKDEQPKEIPTDK